MFITTKRRKEIDDDSIKTRPDGDNGNKEEREKDPSYKPSSDYEVNQKVHCIKQNWQPWQNWFFDAQITGQRRGTKKQDTSEIRCSCVD